MILILINKAISAKCFSEHSKIFKNAQQRGRVVYVC